MKARLSARFSKRSFKDDGQSQAEEEEKDDDDESIEFSVEGDLLTKLDIRKPRLGESISALDQEKLYRYLLDKDIEKIKTSQRISKSRKIWAAQREKNESNHQSLAQKSTLGEDGNFAEVIEKVKMQSWQSTSKPFGIIAQKRYQEYLDSLPKGPKIKEIKDRKQRELDKKLWMKVVSGKLEPTIDELKGVERKIKKFNLFGNKDNDEKNEDAQGLYEPELLKTLEINLEKEKLQQEQKELSTYIDHINQFVEGVAKEQNVGENVNFDELHTTADIDKYIADIMKQEGRVQYTKEINEFAERRRKPTYRQFVDSMNKWKRGVHDYYDFNLGFPVVRYKVIRASEELSQPQNGGLRMKNNTSHESTNKYIKGRYQVEKQYADYLTKENFRRAQLFVEEYMMQARKQERRKKEKLKRKLKKQNKTLYQYELERQQQQIEEDLHRKLQNKRRGITDNLQLSDAVFKLKVQSTEGNLQHTVKLEKIGVGTEDEDEEMKGIKADIKPQVDEDSSDRSSDDDSFVQQQPNATDETNGRTSNEDMYKKKRKSYKWKILNNIVACSETFHHIGHRGYKVIRKNMCICIRRRKHGLRDHSYKSKTEKYREEALQKLTQLTDELYNEELILERLQDVKSNDIAPSDFLMDFKIKKREMRAQINELEGRPFATIDERRKAENIRRRLFLLEEHAQYCATKVERAKQTFEEVKRLVVKKEEEVLKMQETKYEKFQRRFWGFILGNNDEIIGVSKGSGQIYPDSAGHSSGLKKVVIRYLPHIDRNTYFPAVEKVLRQRIQYRTLLYRSKPVIERIRNHMDDPEYFTTKAFSIPKTVDDLVLASQLGDYNEILDCIDNRWNIYDGEGDFYIDDDLHVENVDVNAINSDGETAIFATIHRIIKREILARSLFLGTNKTAHNHTMKNIDFDQLVEETKNSQTWMGSLKRLFSCSFIKSTSEKLMEANLELVIQILLLYGAKLDIPQQSSGMTLLHYAAEEGANDVLQWLLEKGGDANMLTSIGQKTPLMFAIEKNHLHSVMLLLEHGAIIALDMKDNIHEDTALHYAAKYSSTLIAKVLLIAGANAFARNKQNLSPSGIAKSVGRADMLHTIGSYRSQVVDHKNRMDFLFRNFQKDKQKSQQTDDDQADNKEDDTNHDKDEDLGDQRNNIDVDNTDKHRASRKAIIILENKNDKDGTSATNDDEATKEAALQRNVITLKPIENKLRKPLLSPLQVKRRQSAVLQQSNVKARSTSEKKVTAYQPNSIIDEIEKQRVDQLWKAPFKVTNNANSSNSNLRRRPSSASMVINSTNSSITAGKRPHSASIDFRSKVKHQHYQSWRQSNTNDSDVGNGNVTTLRKGNNSASSSNNTMLSSLTRLASFASMRFSVSGKDDDDDESNLDEEDDLLEDLDEDEIAGDETNMPVPTSRKDITNRTIPVKQFKKQTNGATRKGLSRPRKSQVLLIERGLRSNAATKYSSQFDDHYTKKKEEIDKEHSQRFRGPIRNVSRAGIIKENDEIVSAPRVRKTLLQMNFVKKQR